MQRCHLPPTKLLTVAILAMLPVLSAVAGPQAVQQDSRKDPVSVRDNSSLSDAVRRVERDTRGEVLSAERVQYDGRDMHRVKVVDDEGRVRIFMQDPKRHDDDMDSTRSKAESDGNDVRLPTRRKRPTRGNDE